MEVAEPILVEDTAVEMEVPAVIGARSDEVRVFDAAHIFGGESPEEVGIIDFEIADVRGREDGLSEGVGAVLGVSAGAEADIGFGDGDDAGFPGVEVVIEEAFGGFDGLEFEGGKE